MSDILSGLPKESWLIVLNSKDERIEELKEENRKLREVVIKERAYGNAQYDGIDLYWDTPQETEYEYRKRAESELRSEGVIP